jgi:hypothetical protein
VVEWRFLPEINGEMLMLCYDIFRNLFVISVGLSLCINR